MRKVKLSAWPLYALAFLVAFSPFHSFLRLAFPVSPVILLWRDVLTYGLFTLCLGRAVIRGQRMPRHWVGIAIALYMMWGAIMILPSVNLAVGLYGFRTVVRYAPLFFVTLLVVRTEADVRLLSKATLVGAVVLTAIGIYQFFDPGSDLFRLFEDQGVPVQRFGYRELLGYRFPRLDSLYLGGVGGFAVYLTSCIGVVIYAWRSTETRWSRRWYFLLMLTITFVIIFSGSRQAWLGATVIVFLTVRWRRKHRVRRWLLIAAAATPLVSITLRPPPGEPYFLSELADRTLVQLGRYPSDPIVLLFGRGYAFAGSGAGVSDAFKAAVVGEVGVDSQWLFAILQFGLVGALLLMTILLGFIVLAYRMHWKFRRQAAHKVKLEEPKGLIWHPTPILGTFLLVLSSSFHSEPLNYNGVDVNFYVLGGLVVWQWRNRRIAQPQAAPVKPARPVRQRVVRRQAS